MDLREPNLVSAASDSLEPAVPLAGLGYPPHAPGVSAEGRSEDSALAHEIKLRVAAGELEAARDRFGALVSRQQRRASRIAFHFLRNAADADDAVQEAFIKTFVHIASYREELPFEVWFTRILINGCLDREKARRRRWRWLAPFHASLDRRGEEPEPTEGSPSPEDALLDRERRQRLLAAVDRLPDRQRTVIVLCHYDGLTPREVSAVTGLNESTVRVHLHRAVRRLRWLLEASRDTS